MLYGQPGRGKTHAMAAMAFDYFVAGFSIKYMTFEWFALQVRDVFRPNSGLSEAMMIQPLCDADVLFLDDVGTTVSSEGQETDFSLRLLLVVLDTRIKNCLPTYITANKTVEQLRDTFDDRIASRLLEACTVVKLTGEDRRQKNNQVSP